MARVIPSGLQTALEGAPLAGECLVLVARDGTTVGLTTCVRPVTLDLSADDGPASVTCESGLTLSAVTLAVGLDASNAEAQGPLDWPLVGPITRAGVEGGAWSRAEAWLVRVSPGETGHAPVLRGLVADARVEDPRWVFQIRNQADALNQNLEILINGYCRWRFGSAECGATPVELAATVSAVTDAMRFAMTFSGTVANDFFNLGEAEFTSGDLDGVISERLFDFTGGTGSGSVVLREPLSAAPTVGDTLILRQGCELTRLACIAHQGDAVQFGGFPDVPGSDALTYPDGT